MTNSTTWPANISRLRNSFEARRASWAQPASGFVSQPEPRTIGTFAKGRQLCAGNFLFAGYLIESPDTSIWELQSPDAKFEEEINGFTWLDDLAAVGDLPARERAQRWVSQWIDLNGRGKGAGWSPDLTGRRLIRWINHALFLLNGLDRARSDAYFRSLAQQTIYLSRRWRAASIGLPRFEALTGLIYAGLALTGMDRFVEPAMAALARDCVDEIDNNGAIPTRSPEELLEVFTLLTWAASALGEAGKVAAPEILAAIERIAPTLRALRHADGELARFHGGGRGLEGRLDHALAASGVRAGGSGSLAMGYARMAARRTSIIVDASAPPSDRSSANGHASTFAFELTSGRRPLIVNCGSGAAFGSAWRRAGRATPSHSTLGVEGYSSSRLGAAINISGSERELLTDVPRAVWSKKTVSFEGVRIQGGHDGYVRTHGLTHVRDMNMSADGRTVIGEDTLAIAEDRDNAQFDRAMDRASLQGVGFSIRFHLHPDVHAEVDLGGSAVSLALKSGEIWVLRFSGDAELSLDPSVYLEKYRIKPRATKQVVLSGRVMEYAGRVSWSLAKAQDTPTALRDLVNDDVLML